MLRVSLACALVVASVPSAHALFGERLNKADTGETSEESGGGKLDLKKVDLGKLKSDAFNWEKLHLNKPTLGDITFDLPSFGNGLAGEQLPFLRHGAIPPPDEKNGLQGNLHELKKQFDHSVSGLQSKFQHGRTGEPSAVVPPLLSATLRKAYSGTPEVTASMKEDENKGTLGQIFKQQKDEQKVFPSLPRFGKTGSLDFTLPETGPKTNAAVDTHSDAVPWGAGAGEGHALPRVYSEPGKLQKIFTDLKHYYQSIRDKSNKLDIAAHEGVSKSVKLWRLPQYSTKSDEKENAPARRLALLSALGTAKQRIYRKSRDSDTLLAFESEVNELKQKTVRDLASALGTRMKQVDVSLVERVVEKVGLNGLGGPPPPGLSFSENRVMEIAQRRRMKVGEIRSIYERNVRTLLNNLQDGWMLYNKHKSRVSAIVNDRMYTSTALLRV